MDAQIAAHRERIATFGSYIPKCGSAKGARLRFFKHRREMIYAAMGEHLTEVAKIVVERAARLEWELILLDRRIDAGEKLAPDELRVRSSMETRLRNDLASLLPRKRPAAAAPKPKPKKAAAPKKPEPKPVESESRAPTIAEVLVTEKAP